MGRILAVVARTRRNVKAAPAKGNAKVAISAAATVPFAGRAEQLR
jgi:hypothetical protein